MPTIEDEEFGTITVRKSTRSTTMRATVAPNGTLRISIPAYTPMFMAKRMVSSSRTQLRRLLDSRPRLVLSDGMQLGKSHSLQVREGLSFSSRVSGTQLILTLGANDSLSDERVIEEVRSRLLAILRKEAKHHLPKRIDHLSMRMGLTFTSLRFTHASTRWGSCNQDKAISLNIALMSLPFELIDYVLVHELAHTVELNHSKEFWKVVAASDPQYVLHRKQLKQYNPGV